MPTRFKPVLMIAAACAMLLSACSRDLDFSVPAQAPIARPAPVQPPKALMASSPTIVRAAPTMSVRLVEEVAAIADIDAVPLVELPEKPFPYLKRPKAAGEKFERSRVAYERSFILSQGKSQWVDRRRQQTRFRNKDAKLDRASAMRRYQVALRTLGATSVEALEPPGENAGSDDLRTQAESRLPGSWQRYLIRTAQKTIWLGLDIDDVDTRIVVLEERPVKASVGLTKW